MVSSCGEICRQIPNIIFIPCSSNSDHCRLVSFRNLAAAVVGGGSGQDDTASSISSRNVVLL